jgi:AraC-like DNA-binding protein
LIFDFEEKASSSPFVGLIWRTESHLAGSFTSPAVSHCELVVTRYQGRTFLAVRGPETKATPAYSPAGAEFFGIQLTLGSFMPHLPPGSLVDRHAALPGATGHSFWLNDVAWPFPDFDDAEAFVDRLVREGVLAREPVVAAVLQDQLDEHDLSLRSVQRRFLQATGLTSRAMRQIERARQATVLLERGSSILDVVFELGYTDQPHLTKSLKHLIGRTPARIAALV